MGRLIYIPAHADRNIKQNLMDQGYTEIQIRKMKQDGYILLGGFNHSKKLQGYDLVIYEPSGDELGPGPKPVDRFKGLEID